MRTSNANAVINANTNDVNNIVVMARVDHRAHNTFMTQRQHTANEERTTMTICTVLAVLAFVALAVAEFDTSRKAN